MARDEDNVPEEIVDDVPTGIVRGKDLYQEAASIVYDPAKEEGINSQQRQVGKYLLWAAVAAGHEAVRFALATQKQLFPHVDDLEEAFRLRLFRAVTHLMSDPHAKLDPLYDSPEGDALFREHALNMITQLRPTP